MRGSSSPDGPGSDVHLHYRRLGESQEPALERPLGAAPLLDRDLEQVSLLHALGIARRRVHLREAQEYSRNGHDFVRFMPRWKRREFASTINPLNNKGVSSTNSKIL